MRKRLILYFALITLVSVASVVFFARQGAAREVRAFMFRGGMTNTTELAGQLADYYRDNGSWQGVESVFPFAGGRHGAQGMGGQGMGPGMGAQGMGMMNQQVRLADAAGEVLVDSAGSSTTNQGAARLTEDELAQAVPIRSGFRTVGYLLVEGSSPFSLLDEQFLVGRLTSAALRAGLVAGGLSLLLALFLSVNLLRPVKALSTATRHMAEGDLGARVVVHGKDELAFLGSSFNQMAASLQRSEDSRRAMTADIAHELRNPLAVQRATLEALQDGIYPLTPENLTPVLEQNVLLTRLVEDLRTLAQAESGQLPLERALVDLPALVGRVVERFTPQAASLKVDLQTNLSGDCQALRLDPGRIEQILGNLLSNALRYTPPAGLVEINLVCTPQAAHLTVHDSGPGIPAEALDQVFERFYRADRSRSRAEGGSGLGLAIARQLAEAHGATLTAANHPQGGAVFTLVLPGDKGEDSQASG